MKRDAYDELAKGFFESHEIMPYDEYDEPVYERARIAYMRDLARVLRRVALENWVAGHDAGSAIGGSYETLNRITRELEDLSHPPCSQW